jgi:hypothetical protein
MRRKPVGKSRGRPCKPIPLSPKDTEFLSRLLADGDSSNQDSQIIADICEKLGIAPRSAAHACIEAALMRLEFFMIVDRAKGKVGNKRNIFSMSAISMKNERRRRLIMLLALAYRHARMEEPRNAWGTEKITGPFFKFVKTAITMFNCPILSFQSDLALAKEIRRALALKNDPKQIEFEGIALYNLALYKVRGLIRGHAPGPERDALEAELDARAMAWVKDALIEIG